MLDRLGDAVFAEHAAGELLHSAIAHELTVGEGHASLRLDLPFAEKGDISLKKIGAELVVRVDGQKRTIMLPPALAGFHATSASFQEGALQVTFDGADRTDDDTAAG